MALMAGDLDDDLRSRAAGEAHKLAGCLGTFGFGEGSRIARDLELVFAVAEAPRHAEVPQLAALLVALRNELEPTDAPAPSAERPDDPVDAATVLLVDEDDDLAVRLRDAAASAGVRCVAVASPAAAREFLAAQRPDAVLLDVGLRDHSAAMSLLADLSSESGSPPVLVLTAEGRFTDRVEAARHGAAGFLDKSLPLPAVIEALRASLSAPTTGPRSSES